MSWRPVFSHSESLNRQEQMSALSRFTSRRMLSQNGPMSSPSRIKWVTFSTPPAGRGHNVQTMTAWAGGC
jgi:hypothetical protein